MPRTVVPRPVPADASPDHPHLLFNGDLSWIDFNWRVVAQAASEHVPLLERVRFLAIAEGNLDRFVRTNIGALLRQHRDGVAELSADGRTPDEQLRLVREAVDGMRSVLAELWSDDLRPALEAAGIAIVPYERLTTGERARADRVFHERLYPILTPLAVDPAHPFPFISNLSLSLALEVRDPDETRRRFARLKVPTARGRWIAVDDDRRRFLPLESLIARHVATLFPDLQIEGIHPFRVTRSADLVRDEDEYEELIDAIAEGVRERRFAPAVRLEVSPSMPDGIRALLLRELDLEPENVLEVEGPLGLSDLSELADLEVPELRYPRWEPRTPRALQAVDPSRPGDVFAAIRAGDVLIHHPYESFGDSVERFLDAAARDPDVLAIKQTLYRTGEDSPVVRALIRAAEAGKAVAVLVEITASFDEESNIAWARRLESHGVHVSHGVAGLKTHAKVVLVVREEDEEVRTYCHVGTGNYHSTTSRLYTDLGLLTADPAIGRDLVRLFHHITGHAPGQDYDELIIAPRGMRGRFEALIEREIRHREAGDAAGIVAKMNALDDVRMIRLLYRASRAGVPIDLIVRGHCRLRPGVPGFSETIRVISIVGRFLEHDRIFRFENGGHPDLYIGSADWRRRNLDRRVEVVVPVRQPALARRLSDILDTALDDNDTAWELQPDGRYRRRHPAADEEPRGFQEVLLRRARSDTGPRPVDP